MLAQCSAFTSPQVDAEHYETRGPFAEVTRSFLQALTEQRKTARTKDGRNNHLQISFAVTIRTGRVGFVLSLHVLAPANRTVDFIERLNWCKSLQHFRSVESC